MNIQHDFLRIDLISHPESVFPKALRALIEEHNYYKTTLTTEITDFDSLLNELQERAETIKPFIDGTKNPSTLFLCLYRMMKLSNMKEEGESSKSFSILKKNATNFSMTEKDLIKMLKKQSLPIVQLCGLLFVRFFVNQEKIIHYFIKFFMVDTEINIKNNNHFGPVLKLQDLVDTLLMGQKYYDWVLPRLNHNVQKNINLNLKPLSVHRARREYNRTIEDSFVISAECMVLHDGKWKNAILTTKGINELGSGWDWIKANLVEELQT